MSISKEEFYEGAALHRLAREGALHVRYEAPFFILNDGPRVLFKYSTKNRSPWGFTLSEAEQLLLQRRATAEAVVLAFICGADGIAAVPYESLALIASPRNASVHIACYRRHGEHYEVNGPDGVLEGKVPPSRWQRLLEWVEQRGQR